MQTMLCLNNGLISVRQAISKEIAKQTEEFLKRGGKIQEIPTTESGPSRPVRDFSPLV